MMQLFGRRVLVTCCLAAAMMVGSFDVGVAQVAALASPNPAPSIDPILSPDSIRVMIRRGRYDDAERAGRASLTDAMARTATDSASVAVLLDLIVDAAWRSFRKLPDDAEPLAQRGLHIREHGQAGEERDIATALTSLGRIQRKLGQLQAARISFARALEIRRRILPPNDPEIAVSLTSMGLLLKEMGELEDSRRLLEEALRLREARFGVESDEAGASLNNLGGVYTQMGQFGMATALYARSVHLYETRSTVDSVRLGSALNSYSAGLMYLKDWTTGLGVCQRTVGLYEAMFRPDDANLARIRENLAVCLTETDRLKEARSVFEQVLPLMPSMDRTGLNEARCLQNFARLEGRAGRYDSALVMLRRSDAIYRRNPEAGLSYATMLGELGVVEVRAGDLSAAAKTFERVVALRESLLTGSHPDVAAALHDIAWVRWIQGDTTGVLEAMFDARTRNERHFRLAAEALTEGEALRVGSSRKPSLDVALSILAARGDGEEVGRVWDAALRSRGIVFDEMAFRRKALSLAEDSSLAVLSERRAASSRRLASAVFATGTPAFERARTVEMLRSQRDSIDREIATRSRAFRRALERRELGLEAIESALRPGEALVSFVRFNFCETRGMAAAVARAKAEHRDVAAAVDAAFVPSYGAFVLMAQGASPVFVRLASTALVDSTVARWLRAAADPGRGAASLTAGRALRRMVWDTPPIKRLSANRIFIVPDGALALVNFSALPDQGGSFLIDRSYALQLLSTERDLVVEDRGGPANGVLLAMGDVDFDHSVPTESIVEYGPHTSSLRGRTSSCEDLYVSHYTALPFSGAEVREVSKAWMVVRRSSAGDTAHVLTGAAATEAAFKKFAPGASSLHLATHGFFLEGRCEGSGQAAQKEFEESPLLRSGLVLAGANRRAPSDGEDGLLTAEEIAAMDLSSVRCAVLSACNTGRGALLASEGVFGLRRAFRIAGADALITSLWEVDDAATRRWMNLYYAARLSGGMSVADAASAASRLLLGEQRKHGATSSPSAWGAFVAVGGGR